VRPAFPCQRTSREFERLSDDDDQAPIEERKRFLSTMTGFNRADLHRLEELLET
jgi:hypothetical protein